MTVWDSLVLGWAVVVTLLYGVRAYCVHSIREQNPGLYELLGKPFDISRYSWGFLFRVSRYSQFSELTRVLRYVIRAGQVGLVAVMVLTGLISMMLGRSLLFGSRLP